MSVYVGVFRPPPLTEHYGEGRTDAEGKDSNEKCEDAGADERARSSPWGPFADDDPVHNMGPGPTVPRPPLAVEQRERALLVVMTSRLRSRPSGGGELRLRRPLV